MFCVCDHFEPLWAGATLETALSRVRTWRERYPALASEFRDADGRPPRHSFFFPGEQYHPRFLDELGGLARLGLGEVELHLHHDRDDAPGLRRALVDHLAAFAAHGHLAREADGRIRYGFVHGNWSLANARKDGRWCGVDAELPLLFDTGCYADFTFPSAPDETQPRIVNRLYWPTGDLSRARAYDSGEPARVGRAFDDRILMVEGPLAIRRRPGSLAPRIENAALAADDPPTRARVAAWIAQGIHVAGRPDWVFVKVHTHGAPEANAACLLGEPGRVLHSALAERARDGWQLHYVTARELYNIAMAAMRGERGDPGELRDYILGPPPVAS
jgi:hypothetical protein